MSSGRYPRHSGLGSNRIPLSPECELPLGSPVASPVPDRQRGAARQQVHSMVDADSKARIAHQEAAPENAALSISRKGAIFGKQDISMSLPKR
jgi:hypothetical protein